MLSGRTGCDRICLATVARMTRVGWQAGDQSQRAFRRESRMARRSHSSREGTRMNHRSAVRILVPVVILLLGLIMPSAAAAAPRAAPDMTKEVKTLIETYGPIIYFHPDEQYFLDMPEAVLDADATLVWGLVENENNYQTVQQTILGSTVTSTDSLLADVAMARQDPQASDPRFRYWLEIDESLRAGHLQRAKTYVRVLPIGDLQLDLQFWFFSPYNGPVKGKATLSPELQPPTYYFPDTVGRHTGDWEFVALRFARGGSGQGWSLERLFLSQHGGGEWIDAASGAIAFAGTHPVIYAAKDSHAHYATVGEHPFQRVLIQSLGPVTLTVDLIDLTDAGAAFHAYKPGNYRIVSSALPGVKAAGARDWLEYAGRWGEYEKLLFIGTITVFGQTQSFPFAEVGSGPTGPAQKAAWNGVYPMP